MNNFKEQRKKKDKELKLKTWDIVQEMEKMFKILHEEKLEIERLQFDRARIET